MSTSKSITIIEFIHRDTSESLRAQQYTKGMHPPPPGVKVTMGLKGVLARVDTPGGRDMEIFPGEWLVLNDNGSHDIITDSYLHDTYRRASDKPDEGPRPVKLG